MGSLRLIKTSNLTGKSITEIDKTHLICKFDIRYNLDGLWVLIGMDSMTLRVGYRGSNGVSGLHLMCVISDHG